MVDQMKKFIKNKPIKISLNMTLEVNKFVQLYNFKEPKILIKNVLWDLVLG